MILPDSRNVILFTILPSSYFDSKLIIQECHRHSCCEACVGFANIIHMHASAIRRRLYLSRGLTLPSAIFQTIYFLLFCCTGNILGICKIIYWRGTIHTGKRPHFERFGHWFKNCSSQIPKLTILEYPGRIFSHIDPKEHLLLRIPWKIRSQRESFLQRYKFPKRISIPLRSISIPSVAAYR